MFLSLFVYLFIKKNVVSFEQEPGISSGKITSCRLNVVETPAPPLELLDNLSVVMKEVVEGNAVRQPSTAI